MSAVPHGEASQVTRRPLGWMRDIATHSRPLTDLVRYARAIITLESDGTVSLQLALSAEPVQFIVVLGARAQNPGVSYVDHYKILGLLPDPQGGLSDITELYLDAFKLLPAGKRVFIRTVQQINGWRDLPKTISARIPVQ